MTIFEKPLPPTPVLETPRLILHPLMPADAPVIQRRFPRWEIVRYLNRRVPWPYPEDGAIRFIEICQGEMADDRGSRPSDRLRLRDLDWPHLWVSNDELNHPSARVKERQGARLVGFEPCRSVSGEGRRMVWLIEREGWLARGRS
jgi:RimJ/RimL family protein N-acetyltransferase